MRVVLRWLRGREVNRVGSDRACAWGSEATKRKPRSTYHPSSRKQRAAAGQLGNISLNVPTAVTDFAKIISYIEHPSHLPITPSAPSLQSPYSP